MLQTRYTDITLPMPCTIGQRSTIERLVLLLGGTFCKSLGRKHRATHLILPRWGPDATAADGGSSTTSSAQQIPDSTLKKIAYAQRHRLEMVVSEWLLDCAAEGRRVQEGLHRPDGDVTLLQLPAAGATQAGGATQLGSTQAYGLQQTQSQVSSFWVGRGMDCAKWPMRQGRRPGRQK